MNKKTVSIVMCIVLLLGVVFAFTACNTTPPAEFELPTGSRPNYSSLFTAKDLAIIESGMKEDATAQEKKRAVMTLYNTANQSRLNTPLSLVVQESDAGIPLGSVIMHAFNLRSGDKWYYQLATEVSSNSSFMQTLVTEIAGYLKVGYTQGDGQYYYFSDLGGKYGCDCSLTVFPYASFGIPDNANAFEKPMTLAEFNDRLHVLTAIHEINNMNFCEDIIAEDAVITFENGYYTVKFSVDMDADEDLIKQWYAMPQADMKEGGQEIKCYNSYEATLEVWDNGYAKSYESHSDRLSESGLADGAPVDRFSYIWDENEIMELLKQDESIDKADAITFSVEDYIDYYSNPAFVEAKLGFFEILGIVLGCVAFVIIVVVVVVEVLAKKGKLPKLVAYRAKKKEKRQAKKAEKANAKINEGDVNATPSDEPIDEAFGVDAENDESAEEVAQEDVDEFTLEEE